MQPWFWCWPHTNLPSSTYFLWCLSFYFLNCSNFVFSSLLLNFVLELSKYWSIRILNYQHIVKTWLTYAIVMHSIYIFVNPNHNVIIRNIFDKSLYARSQFHIFALNFVDLNYAFFYLIHEEQQVMHLVIIYLCWNILRCIYAYITNKQSLLLWICVIDRRVKEYIRFVVRCKDHGIYYVNNQGKFN